MYTLDLICSNGHRFETWFSSRASFEEQRDEALIGCPHCFDTNVQQAISPVRIKKHCDAPQASAKPTPKTPTIPEIIEKHFEDVGQKFADEAMKIHVGDSEKRNICGTATPDEEKSLADEGIPFFKIPEFQ